MLRILLRAGLMIVAMQELPKFKCFSHLLMGHV